LAHSREPFIIALAGGANISEATRVTGIALSTAKRWLSDPELRSHVEAVRQRMVDEAVGRLAALAGKAIATLDTALDAESDGVRVRAAVAILDKLLQLREHTELETRILALEESLATLTEEKADAERGRPSRAA
jgi:phage terminase small subunit